MLVIILINQFHPLMRFITDDLKKRNLSSYPLVSLQVKLSDQQLFEKGDVVPFNQIYGLVEKIVTSLIRQKSKDDPNFQFAKYFKQDVSWTDMKTGVHSQFDIATSMYNKDPLERFSSLMAERKITAL